MAIWDGLKSRLGLKKPGGGKTGTRIVLVLSPELDDRIDRWAVQSSASRAAVIGKAFALYDVARRAEGEGKRLAVLSADGAVEAEIVSIR